MTDSRRLKVSEMDFDQIKDNLKEYLSDQTTLTDYDFEGSALGTLLDVVAYMTHMNAMNANQAINETFLDTAQLRSSVVSHAKLLGYTPRSSFAPVAYIDIVLNDPVNPGPPITMDKGTRFKTVINGETFNFVTIDTITVPLLDGVYKFEDVRIIQGDYKKTGYSYDFETSEKFIIPYDNIVTSTLSVDISPSKASSSFETYVKAPTVVDINDRSKIYFLSESVTGEYEVKFGDGVFGRKLENGNYIRMSYVVTDEEAANGASQFALVDDIEGSVNATITTKQKAVGGSTREDLESIQFNAPLLYTAQNRAVTPDDYKSIILNNYSNIEAITVWGGEDNDPPDYGKVYISIKPLDGEVVGDRDKDIIIDQFLKPKNVVSITPILVDPTYTYIDLEVFFKYNPNITSHDRTTLEDLVRDTIIDYNNNDLKRFDGVFRHSNLISSIDNSDVAILNSVMRTKMKKRFNPILNQEAFYLLDFPNPFFVKDDDNPIIRTTPFVYQGDTCHLIDVAAEGGKRVLKIQRVSNETIANHDVGYIEPSTGKVIIQGFKIESYENSYIEITVVPDTYDLAPRRTELLTILTDDASIIGEVDTMITGGTAAGVNYTTTPRF